MNATKWLTPEQVAKMMQVTLRTIYSMCKAGELPCVKVGRQWRISPDFIDHLAASKVDSETQAQAA